MHSFCTSRKTVPHLSRRASTLWKTRAGFPLYKDERETRFAAHAINPCATGIAVFLSLAKLKKFGLGECSFNL